MFLRSDYALMVDNSLKLAAKFSELAGEYTAWANEATGMERNDRLISASAFLDKATQHFLDAEYWMTMIPSEESEYV